MQSVPKRTLTLSLVLCFTLGLWAVALAAGQQEEKKGTNKTVTGCLQKSDEANEFRITAEDGKIYDLRSSSVQLAEHVGHQVTVTGSFKPEGGKEEDESKEAKEGGKKEAGDIQVQKLKMVSEKCQ
jgi:hypothetical protein